MVALVAVLGLVGATAPSSCAPVPKVLVIGDSLTVGADQQGMGDGSSWRWEVVAADRLSTNQGIAFASALPIEGYDLVIVALGTNDYLDSAAVYGARIDKMMAALADAPKVVWVNVDTVKSKLAPAAAGVNAAIAAARSRHRTLRLGDWDAYVRAVPDMGTYRKGDLVHYNAAGNALRARWMEDRVPG